MTEHCSNCGEPTDEDAPHPNEVGESYEGPIQGGGKRVYCSVSCAAEKQGWAYEST